MPSKNTSVISARVKDEIALKLGEIADSKGISIAKLIEEMVLESETKKGVTPDGCADCEYSDEIFHYKELGIDGLIAAFEKRNYPEHEIRRQIGMMIEQIDYHGNYNPRRAGSEYA